MVDTLRRRATPEGVALTFRVAGIPSRSAAWAIDAFIISMIWAFVSIVISIFQDYAQGFMLLAFFVLQWFYGVFYEVMRAGATPGKKLFGLRVIHDDGTPIGWSASIIRNLLRSADFLPFGYAAGVVSMLVHRDFKRLGDLAGGTLVVHDASVEATAGSVPKAPPFPPPVQLSREERQAIVGFGARLGGWHRERAEELAQLAAPLTSRLDVSSDHYVDDDAVADVDFSPGHRGVQRLLGMANWILGRYRAS